VVEEGDEFGEVAGVVTWLAEENCEREGVIEGLSCVCI
jgi:hypothetical protein